MSKFWSRSVPTVLVTVASLVVALSFVLDMVRDQTLESRFPQWSITYIQKYASEFSMLTPLRCGALAAFLIHLAISARFLAGAHVKHDFRRTLLGMIHGAGLLYIAFLTLQLVQSSSNDIRDVMQVLVGGEGSVSQDTMPSVEHEGPSGEDALGDLNFCMMHNMDKTINIYILAHLVGYTAIGFFTRDQLMSHFLSVTFEIVEVALQHWIHDFRECWWDHIVVDVLICNPIGIYLGLWLAKTTGYKSFQWLKGENVSFSLFDLVNPWAWVKKEWIVFTSFSNLLAASAIFIYVTLAELQSFMLKDIWGISASHWFMVLRVVIVFPLGAGAATILYEDIFHKKQLSIEPKKSDNKQSTTETKKSDKKKAKQSAKRLNENQATTEATSTPQKETRTETPLGRGLSLWLAIAVVILESLTNLRFAIPSIISRANPTPGHIWIPLVAMATFSIVWFVVHFILLGWAANNRWYKWIPSGTLLFAIVASCVILFLAGTPDIRILRDEMDFYGKQDLVTNVEILTTWFKEHGIDGLVNKIMG